ncbi:MAG TPA: right-handed parallel beta-helix repeat-containing protein [Phycisphaerae bacterium]|nr:right-handed parallel beta-helix repeat-containing protein [Phycisphaerae bacterium]
MNRIQLLCLLSLVIAAMAARSAPATDYYVSAKGHDSAAGTSADKPLKTIGAATARLQAGDTLHIAPGAYDGRAKLTASGTEDKPITIKGAGRDKVTWTMTPPDPKTWDDRYALQVRNAKHVAVEGITFKDCSFWIMLWESDHCTVRNCTFDGARGYNAFRINNGSYNRVLNCTFVRAVKQTGFRPEANWIPTPGADYIEIFRGSNNNLVQDCTFGPITHTAVSISAVDKKKFSPNGNLVRYCTFKDPYWKCFWVHCGKHNLIEHCQCQGTSACFLQLEAGTTIIRRNAFVGYRDSTNANPDKTLRGVVRMQYSEAQGNRIYHNVFYDNDRTLTNNSYNWHVTGNVFKNNIFFRNRQTVLLGFADPATRNRNYFLSNLMIGAEPGEALIELPWLVARPAGTTARFQTLTLAEAQKSLPKLYKGNIEADPKFVDAAKGDFNLKAASPCIDAGAHLTRTTAAGKGNRVPVDDALYFCDGGGMIDGDRVIVGANKPVKITRVDYDGKLLIVDRDIAWGEGDRVSQPYRGKAPDIGAFEHGD